MNAIRREIKSCRCTAYRFITINRTGYGIPPNVQADLPATVDSASGKDVIAG